MGFFDALKKFFLGEEEPEKKEETTTEEKPVLDEPSIIEPAVEEVKKEEQAEEPAKEEQVSETPAKKRGRPAKKTDAEKGEAKSETPARKRGRPAKTAKKTRPVKKKLDIKPVVEIKEESETPVKKKGRPAKEKTEAVEVKKEEVKSETPAKKRGRPAKAKEETKTVSEPAAEAPAKKTEVKKEETKTEAPARKRGRPARVKEEVKSVDEPKTETTEEVKAAAPVKKKGRPAKTKEKETEESQPESVEALLDTVENEDLLQILLSTDKKTLQMVVMKMMGYAPKEISHHMELPEQTVYADPDMMQRALHNLLGNAMHHIGKDGIFILRAFRCSEGVRVEVEDHGPGIAAADLPYIFDKFRRSASKESNYEVQGFGLGLNYVQQVVSLLSSQRLFT